MMTSLLRATRAGLVIPARCSTSKLLLVPSPTPLVHRVRHYSLTTSGEYVADELTTREYHRLADRLLESLVDQLEQLSEEYPQLDVEYSQGVMTLECPPLGTYVINKQPPNKQIWISSPESGPDRFDPIGGAWVSLRTRLSLKHLLDTEIGGSLGTKVDFEF